MSCPSSYFLRYRCVPCESLVVGDKPILTMDSSEEWKEQLSGLKNAIYLNDLTVTARNGKKNAVDFYFRLRKKKKCAQKIHRFLNSLAKFQLVRCKKPT